MINPLEVVIQAVKSLEPSWQVASKINFVGYPGSSGLWPINSEAIVIRLDGGNPEIYLPIHDIRLEVRCFGLSDVSALTFLLEFKELAELVNREAVVVTGGTGLLYNILPDSGPSLLIDPDLNKDFALQFFRARVHVQGVE